MKQQRRRRCKCCGALYTPDPRNCRHQQYCSKPQCRKASKAESQRRWRNKPKGRNYFRGPENTQRVREWRKKHPDYAKRRSRLGVPPVTSEDAKCPQSLATQANTADLSADALSEQALQDVLSAKPIGAQGISSDLTEPALQDVISFQPLILIGLIANLTGTALQDDIAETTRRLLRLGQDILTSGAHAEGESDADKASVMSNPSAPGSPALQLGGSPAGSG